MTSKCWGCDAARENEPLYTIVRICLKGMIREDDMCYPCFFRYFRIKGGLVCGCESVMDYHEVTHWARWINGDWETSW